MTLTPHSLFPVFSLYLAAGLVMTAKAQGNLSEKWQAAWPEALAIWSRFTRLQLAKLCPTVEAARAEGLDGSFAMIRFVDQRVVIDLQTVAELGLDDYALEILAHEIGHHVLAPANATDNLRLLARMRQALPTLTQHAPMLANLHTDFLAMLSSHSFFHSKHK